MGKCTPHRRAPSPPTHVLALLHRHAGHARHGLHAQLQQSLAALLLAAALLGTAGLHACLVSDQTHKLARERALHSAHMLMHARGPRVHVCTRAWTTTSAHGKGQCARLTPRTSSIISGVAVPTADSGFVVAGADIIARGAGGKQARLLKRGWGSCNRVAARKQEHRWDFGITQSLLCTRET